MSNEYLEKRLSRFITHMENSSMEKYFGIVCKPGTKLQISIQKEETTLILHIRFIKTYSFDIMNLPSEINNIILSYTSEYIDISLDITYLGRYPFVQPIWYLSNVLTNIVEPLDLTEYYKYIVNNHNEGYKTGWSPAIDIEKDILYFITKINHFDYIIEN
jgi:hypothetical protein